MSLRYVLFRDDPSSHDEVYLARAPEGGFHAVKSVEESNLIFETAAEGYAFGADFPQLDYWKVGYR
jgi:hypothetical protein